jgi:hypothetical protein
LVHVQMREREQYSRHIVMPFIPANTDNVGIV